MMYRRIVSRFLRGPRTWFWGNLTRRRVCSVFIIAAILCATSLYLWRIFSARAVSTYHSCSPPPTTTADIAFCAFAENISNTEIRTRRTCKVAYPRTLKCCVASYRD